MLTIYGVYRSRASRPLWLLKESGTEFRHEPVIQAYRLADPSAADVPVSTASASFLAVNPQGQIPAMDDDGFILTESLAITLYLAKRYGGDLGPKDDRESALMTQWALVAATGIEPPAIEIMYTTTQGRIGTPEGDAAIVKADQALTRPFARLEGMLSARNWLVGNRFTAADICVAECVRYASSHDELMQAHPHLTAWLARCHDRPGFKAMWAARLAEPA